MTQLGKYLKASPLPPARSSRPLANELAGHARLAGWAVGMAGLTEFCWAGLAELPGSSVLAAYRLAGLAKMLGLAGFAGFAGWSV